MEVHYMEGAGVEREEFREATRVSLDDDVFWLTNDDKDFVAAVPSRLVRSIVALRKPVT